MKQISPIWSYQRACRILAKIRGGTRREKYRRMKKRAWEVEQRFSTNGVLHRPRFGGIERTIIIRGIVWREA